MDLDELYGAYARGEPNARERLAVALDTRLSRFFMDHCRDEVDANTLGSHAAGIVFEQLALDRFVLRHPGAFSGWVFTIARGVANNYHRERAKARRRAATLDSAIAEPGAGISAEFVLYQQREVLAELLELLPHHERRTIEGELAGLSIEELAREEQVKVTTIHTRRHRARARLIELFAEHRRTPSSAR